MKRFTYTPTGSCATRIEIELDGETIHRVRFTDGCPGNHRAMEALVQGRQVRDVIALLKGIACQGETSCPDQLAMALEQATKKA